MMSNADRVADSTDWLATPLAPLAPLESSLRCQVCKDFFTTPVMTSCSHTFCSLCIRRYLSQEGRCPACREQDQEMKLRRNWVVEELVVNFTASRDGLLKLARSAIQKQGGVPGESPRPKKRRKVTHPTKNSNGDGDGVERRSTRSQSRMIASQASQPSTTSSQEEIADSDEGSVYEDGLLVNAEPGVADTEQNDGLVACPCCRRRMKEAVINSHLDRCIAGDSRTADESSSPAPTPQLAPGTIAYSQTKPTKQKERLPFINYSIINDNALRKKLKELGIPTHGAKDLMRRRHTEWVNLWNANCDSRNPVSKSKLLQDLDAWERTLSRQIEKGPSGFMAKDFDREAHVKAQKSNFDELIRQARQKRAAAGRRTEAVEQAATPVPAPAQAPSPDIVEAAIFTSEKSSPSGEWDGASAANPVDLTGGPPADDLVDLTSSAKPPPEPTLSQKSMSNDIAV